MIRIAAALRRRDDEGLTLIELLVALCLTLIIMVAASGLMISASKATAVTQASELNTRQASNVIATMSRYFHAATTFPVAASPTPLPAIASASATDVTFYAYVNLTSTANQPVKVRYYIDSTTQQLKEQIWQSTCDANTGYCTFAVSSTTRTIGGAVASPTSDGKPLFTYLNQGGAVTTDLGSIANVTINLELGSATAGAAGNTHITTTIGLLNLGLAGT